MKAKPVYDKYGVCVIVCVCVVCVIPSVTRLPIAAALMDCVCVYFSLPFAIRRLLAAMACYLSRFHLLLLRLRP